MGPLMSGALKAPGLFMSLEPKHYPPPKKHRHHEHPSRSPPQPQPRYNTMTTPIDPQEIIELEEQTWIALQSSGEEMLRFLADDCVMNFPLGLQVSQQSEPNIRDILTSDAFVPWDKHKLLNVVVTPVGNDGAVISYRAHAKRPGTGEFRALIVSVWRRDEKGKLLMCVHQQTPFETGIEDLADEEAVA